MSPWANDFAQWRREQAELASVATALGLESDVDAYADSAVEVDAANPASGLVSDVVADAYARADDAEDVNGLEETRGCAILDSGSTVMCSSTIVAEGIQMQRLNREEPGQPTVSNSDRRFRFADGPVDEAQKSWNNR